MDFKWFGILSLAQVLLNIAELTDGKNVHDDPDVPFYHDYETIDTKQKETNISCEPDGSRLKVVLSSRCTACRQPQMVFVLDCNSQEEIRNRTLDALDHETVFYDLQRGTYKIVVQRDSVFTVKVTCCQIKEIDAPDRHIVVVVVTISVCLLLVIVLSITALVTRYKIRNAKQQRDRELDHHELLPNNLREQTVDSYQV